MAPGRRIPVGESITPGDISRPLVHCDRPPAETRQPSHPLRYTPWWMHCPLWRCLEVSTVQSPQSRVHSPESTVHRSTGVQRPQSIHVLHTILNEWTTCSQPGEAADTQYATRRHTDTQTTDTDTGNMAGGPPLPHPPKAQHNQNNFGRLSPSTISHTPVIALPACSVHITLTAPGSFLSHLLTLS